MAIKHSKLPIGAKFFIVRCLARFERPRTILAHVEEHWNIQLHKSTVNHYNPRYNPDLDATMRELFDVTRAKFLEEKDNIGLNSLHVRQQMRDEFIGDAGRNIALKREILNDAAKDVGGQFSYRPTGVSVAPPDDDFKVMGDNLAHASNEDLARIMSNTPDEMIAPDILEFMIEKGFRKRRAALPVTPVIEGEIVGRDALRRD